MKPHGKEQVNLLGACVHVKGFDEINEYPKHPQISSTFFPKIVAGNQQCGFSAGTLERGCFWCPVFHLCIRSNAWLLSDEHFAHVLVVMQKSMEKPVLNKEIHVNKY